MEYTIIGIPERTSMWKEIEDSWVKPGDLQEFDLDIQYIKIRKKELVSTHA